MNLGLLYHLIFAADKPTRQQLIMINKRDGTKLHIINRFASHSKHQLEDFANLLLNDDDKVKALEEDNKEKNKFIREVLYYWLDLDDDDPGYPRTWEALGTCVSDAGLDKPFAKAIRETYYPDPPAGVCVCVCARMHVCVCEHFMILVKLILLIFKRFGILYEKKTCTCSFTTPFLEVLCNFFSENESNCNYKVHNIKKR